ncbi:MAG: YHS domain-containing protein [Chloroflexi bacterium]|nr:MAG: YHS domain-containing protein [Chloroflexota bacterium]
MSEALSIVDLARRTGEPVDRLCEWRALGLISARDQECFGPESVERTRLVQLFVRRGIGLEAIAAWVSSGRMERYLELLVPGTSETGYSIAEAATMLGLDPTLVERMARAASLGAADGTFAAEDVAMLRGLKTALEAGCPEDALEQFARVCSDALGRVAESEAHLFHFYFRHRLQAQGLSGPELSEAMNAAGRLMTPLAEPAVLYFHRRAQERAMREEAVMELADEAGLHGQGEVPGQLTAAIVFVDLSSFTPLAEAMGDVKAAEVLERFSGLVRDAASRSDGRVVKQIGDAFMLVFPDPRSALACALEIERRTMAEPQFPAVRSGIHSGRVLYREGDYVGANVNLASRLAAGAERHEVLVTGAVRREASGLAGVEFVGLGKRRLKGIAEELELFAARPAEATARERVVDPVCGMELRPTEVAARLALEGKEVAFCSQECLRRFVGAPERYGCRQDV